mmetsp:Transcript_54268/g.117360  ORF Transcript_54268/g.117360 Transcript_54268/m.117360 type:complete len:567 (-) Transcript_54268:35-1735(-)
MAPLASSLPDMISAPFDEVVSVLRGARYPATFEIQWALREGKDGDETERTLVTSRADRGDRGALLGPCEGSPGFGLSPPRWGASTDGSVGNSPSASGEASCSCNNAYQAEQLLKKLLDCLAKPPSQMEPLWQLQSESARLRTDSPNMAELCRQRAPESEVVRAPAGVAAAALRSPSTSSRSLGRAPSSSQLEGSEPRTREPSQGAHGNPQSPVAAEAPARPLIARLSEASLYRPEAQLGRAAEGASAVKAQVRASAASFASGTVASPGICSSWIAGRLGSQEASPSTVQGHRSSRAGDRNPLASDFPQAPLKVEGSVPSHSLRKKYGLDLEPQAPARSSTPPRMPGLSPSCAAGDLGSKADGPDLEPKPVGASFAACWSESRTLSRIRAFREEVLGAPSPMRCGPERERLSTRWDMPLAQLSEQERAVEPARDALSGSWRSDGRAAALPFATERSQASLGSISRSASQTALQGQDHTRLSNLLRGGEGHASLPTLAGWEGNATSSTSAAARSRAAASVASNLSSPDTLASGASVTCLRCSSSFTPDSAFCRRCGSRRPPDPPAAWA